MEEQGFIDWMIFGAQESSPTSGLLHTGFAAAVGATIWEFTRGTALNAVGGAKLVKSRNIAAGRAVTRTTEQPTNRLEDMT